MNKIFLYEVKNISRSRWTLAFTALFFLISENLFLLEGQGAKVILSLFNFTILFIPVISLFYGVTFLYNEKPFIEMLLSQPLERSAIFNGMYFGLATTLSGGMLVGIGLPVILHAHSTHVPLDVLGIFLVSSVLLNFIFTGIAAVGAFTFIDRAKGLLFVIGFWLFTFILYDVTILILSYILRDYPVERVMLGLTLLNPVDIARIVILLQFDIAALLGYSAAIYHNVFGNAFASIFLLLFLLLWALGVYVLARRLFTRRDFINS